MTPDKRVENPTFYNAVVCSPQWRAWVKKNEENPQWDVHESMECGWLSQGHFQAFLTQYHQDLISELVERLEMMKRDQDAPKPGDPYFTGCGGCGEDYEAICGCREVNQALTDAIALIRTTLDVTSEESN